MPGVPSIRIPRTASGPGAVPGVGRATPVAPDAGPRRVVWARGWRHRPQAHRGAGATRSPGTGSRPGPGRGRVAAGWSARRGRWRVTPVRTRRARASRGAPDRRARTQPAPSRRWSGGAGRRLRQRVRRPTHRPVASPRSILGSRWAPRRRPRARARTCSRCRPRCPTLPRSVGSDLTTPRDRPARAANARCRHRPLDDVRRARRWCRDGRSSSCRQTTTSAGQGRAARCGQRSSVWGMIHVIHGAQCRTATFPTDPPKH
jgi:hypothetical protein